MNWYWFCAKPALATGKGRVWGRWKDVPVTFHTISSARRKNESTRQDRITQKRYGIPNKFGQSASYVDKPACWWWCWRWEDGTGGSVSLLPRGLDTIVVCRLWLRGLMWNRWGKKQRPWSIARGSSADSGSLICTRLQAPSTKSKRTTRAVPASVRISSDWRLWL